MEVVTAVASMTAHGILGNDPTLHERIIEAMSAAVRKCHDAGITDVEAIRGAQIAARDAVVAKAG